MEKNQILKEIGFSESFLKSLDEFNKSIPNIELKTSFEPNLENVNSIQDIASFNIISSSNDYNQNLIVHMK